ncbi:MAG: hypothetical protein ACTHLC_06435 [Rhizobiaceae bacterium]
MDSTMAIPGSLIDMFSPLRRSRRKKKSRPESLLVQAEEGQDGHDHDDKSDQIDDPVHVASPLLMMECGKNARGTNTFPEHTAAARGRLAQ